MLIGKLVPPELLLLELLLLLDDDELPKILFHKSVSQLLLEEELLDVVADAGDTANSDAAKKTAKMSRFDFFISVLCFKCFFSGKYRAQFKIHAFFIKNLKRRLVYTKTCFF